MTVFSILVGLAICGPIVGHFVREWKQQERERRAVVEYETGCRVFEILNETHRSLDRQKVRGYGPWLSCLIERRCGDANVALTAVRFTIRDLAGSRFNLDALNKAAAELKEMGAGE